MHPGFPCAQQMHNGVGQKVTQLMRAARDDGSVFVRKQAMKLD